MNLNKWDKIIVSVLLDSWVIIVVAIFVFQFDFLQTPFFSFGPSANLYTVGVNYNIDTWPRYFAISSYLICQGFIITFAGDYIYPWIDAVVLNPDVKTIRVPKLLSWILTNNMYFAFTLTSLFSLGASWAQIDLFVYSNASSLIAGAIQSAIKVSQKQYELPL